jgi:diaminohydroxyphosphoribosylaminopyrimidine deaminase / 5-amino-6-(5-phosphoribosylamino)uracil reductase
LDQNFRIPKESHINDNEVKTIIISNSLTAIIEENSIFEAIDFKKNIAKQILNTLHKHQIQSVIIEGGSQTLQTFIDENLWDEARVFIGNKNFETGIKAPILALKSSKKQAIKNDKLIIFRNYD